MRTFVSHSFLHFIAFFSLLIGPDVAITAAHCVDGTAGFPGALRFNSQSRSIGGIYAKVTRGVIHPDWTTGNAASTDVAVMFLQSPVGLDAVELNQDAGRPSTAGEPLLASGFGLTTASSGVSNVLMSTTIPFLTDCSSRLNVYEGFRHVCADSSYTATCAGGTL